MVVTYGDPQAALAAEQVERAEKAAKLQEEVRRKWREAKRRQKAAKQAAPQTTTSGTGTSGSTVTYVPSAGEVGKVNVTTAKKWKKKRGKIRSKWEYAGFYPTRAEVKKARVGFKRNGYAVRSLKVEGGGFDVYIKRERGAIGVKSAVETTGRTIAKLTEPGTVPQYTPPDMSIKGTYYKPIAYKPVEGGAYYKPMKYEPAFKQFQPYKPIGNEPYYRSKEYVPIGQFGATIGPVPAQRQVPMVSVPRKRKRKYVRKEPRLTGV